MTIQELSQELNISAQALRQWCKRNGVRKESENETKGKKAGYFLTENDVEQIRNYYSTKGNERKDSAKGKESKSNQTLDILQAQLSEKDKQISELQKQLADAATERKQLTAERQTTLARLFSLEDTNKELQMELNKYKVIADSKQTVVEVDSVNEPAETEAPEPKLSFFERLFRRSKRSK